MSKLDRRRFLKGALLALVQTAGSVVLASTVVPGTQTKAAVEKEPSPKDIQQRADQLPPVEESGEEAVSAFVNGGFKMMAPFNNGGFRNSTFTNGSFNNGGFKNGGFVNGSFNNGGFRNGGFVKSPGFNNIF